VRTAAYEAIEKRFKCPHERRELRLRTIVDGRTAYYRQCVVCGNGGNAVSAKAAALELGDALSAPRYNDDLESEWFARKHIAYLKTYSQIKPQMKSEYEAYLRSPEWAELRSQILARSSNVCEVCEHFPATQVHHITYERIGAELPNDLLAVCCFCHGLLHDKKDV